MSNLTATAVANANIAFIKYWGNLDDRLRIPANGSLSMNLAGLETRTTVTFSTGYPADALQLNGSPAADQVLARVGSFLDVVREMAGSHLFARVESNNNFPTGAGIASSAAAFAALALAASTAAGLSLKESQLSALARRGSGSACRSVPSGFVEWLPASTDATSFAVSIAPPDHWDLVDCIAVVADEHKQTGSTGGHAVANTSPLQNARIQGAADRLSACKNALLARDFEKFAAMVELDSNLMHAVMMTSTPPLFYWQPASIELMKQVPEWRRQNIPVCYTLDAGPNVHLLCPISAAGQVKSLLREIPGVKKVLAAQPGGPAHLEHAEANE